MSFKDKRITELDELTSPAVGDYLPIVDVSDTAAGTTKKISFSTIGANAVVNATNITSGTVADARLSANVTLQGNSFNAASKLVQLDGSGRYPALDGSQITSLTKAQVGLSTVPDVDCTNAGNISTGTLSDSRLSVNVSIKTKIVTPIAAGGVYPITSIANDSWYVTSHAAGTVNFVLNNSPSLAPGTEIKIFTNTAQAVSFSTDTSVTAMYVGGSIAPSSTYTPIAAAGKTISVHCVGTNLVFISGL